MVEGERAEGCHFPDKLTTLWYQSNRTVPIEWFKVNKKVNKIGVHSSK